MAKLNINKFTKYLKKNKKYLLFIGLILFLVLVLFSNNYNNFKNKVLNLLSFNNNGNNGINENNRNIENFVNAYSCKKGTMGTVYDEIFGKYSINFNDKDKNSEIYLPCYYDNAEIEIMKVKPNIKNQKIHMIKGCDKLVSKLNLWNTIYQKYGFDEATRLVPRGYSMKHEEQRKEFINNFFKEENKEKIYILKSIRQRQEGIKLSRDMKEIIDSIKDGFTLVQEFVPNPLTIDGYKLDFRIYILIVCKQKKMEAYIHNDAPVHYGKKIYDKESMEKLDSGSFIASGIPSLGYKIEKHLGKRPTTLIDLAEWVKKNKNSKFDLHDKVKHVMIKVMDAFKNDICTDSHLDEHTRFQLFGTDFLLLDDLSVRLLEFNKGSDMTYDRKELQLVKQKLVEDMFEVMDIVKPNRKAGNKNDFVKIWEYEKT